MKAKSQITIYMLVGLVILLVVSLLVLFVPGIQQRFSKSSQAATYASDCFHTTHYCAIHAIGVRGGNLQASKDFEELSSIKLLSQAYFNKAAGYCQSKYLSPAEAVSFEPPVSEFSFNKKDTTSKINAEVKTELKGVTSTVSDFVTKIPVRFESCYNLADSIRTPTLKTIDKSYINAYLLEDQYIDADVYEADNETNVFVLTDRESRIQDTFYKFMFLR